MAPAPLISDLHSTLLDAVLDAIVPASPDGALPSGSGVGFAHTLVTQSQGAWLSDGLAQLALDAGADHFVALGPEQRLELLKSRHFTFLNGVSKALMHCYYQDRRVMQAIGLEPRAPFPLGYHVEDGDWTLLESVYDRGPLYRIV